MKKTIFAYTLFHLNLAYSSIEESSHSTVIDKCYRPILALARNLNVPISIEASGYTLERIDQLAPDWLIELRQLMADGWCEFVGSGYGQLIGPLVPARVNEMNLTLGHQVYDKLLGARPQVALVNEQAYSSGLVTHYLDAGYTAIIMEWDNPSRFHPEWEPNWSYLPQMACDQHSRKIPLIWNRSIAFQKFQRYAYQEISLTSYIDYLAAHLSTGPRILPIYCNDAEIFDYRPGRYATEPALAKLGEWERIQALFETLKEDKRFNLITLSETLAFIREPEAGQMLSLESPEQPIPVKKQSKYNITRWAVTGRDDLGINTACWRIYEKLRTSPS